MTKITCHYHTTQPNEQRTIAVLNILGTIKVKVHGCGDNPNKIITYRARSIIIKLRTLRIDISLYEILDQRSELTIYENNKDDGVFRSE